MKTQFLLGALLGFAVAASAQPPDPIAKPVNGLPFPLVKPAEAEKLAALAPIRLRLKNATVAAALEELQTQSGIELDLENVNYSKRTLAKRISLETDTPSFNRAFEQIMDAAGLNGNLQRYDNNRPWRVDFNRGRSNDDGGNAPQAGEGLFTVQLLRLNTRFSKTLDISDINAPARTQQNNLSVSLALNPDQRLPLIGTARPRLTRAEDEQGRSLLKEENENQRFFRSYSFYGQNNSERQVSLSLQTPEPDAKTLSHLDGVVVYALVTKTEKWEIPDLLSEKEWTREFKSGEHQLTATIKAAPGKSEGSITVSVEIVSDLRVENDEIGPPLLGAQPLLDALKVVDANNNMLRNSGSNSSGNPTQGKFSISTTFYANDPYSDYGDGKKKLALPLKLIFEAPLEAVQTEAPFSFSNIALP